MLAAVAFAGLAASARFAIAPPSAPRAVPSRGLPPRDRGAEGFATLFARRYLTWDASQQASGRESLEAFAGPSVETGGGITLPPAGKQHVEWAEVVQEPVESSGGRVFTVAAQTDTAGLLYLAVSVLRSPAGDLQLGGYPALIGAPTSGPARALPHLTEVRDHGLVTVLERALRNYLADLPGELAADLARGARVAPPTLALSLESVERLDWTPDGSSVLAVVRARDARGARYTLAYELEVVVAQGRWEITAVEMDPGA
jgi:Conjugative transposon protein TcpC